MLTLSLATQNNVRHFRRRPLFGALALTAILFALASPFRAHAVLISTGDGTGNTTAPAADPGFANVGIVGGLSGVYVRNGWVLTANHVGDNPILLLGVSYDPVPGSRVRFQNPDLTLADLIVYKLQSKPPLPDLQIADSAPTVNTSLTLIGNGFGRAAAITFLGVNGWNWGGGKTLRWGTNRIFDADEVSLDTQSFWTIFDENPAGPPGQHEADVVNGDSGGGAFTGSGASAKLVGILFARLAFVDQPLGTSIFGNAGVIADLFFYRADILAIIDQPDCSDGLDDDGDGLIDFPDDPGCSDAFDSNERGNTSQCDNGIDDDGDGDIDFPADSDCQDPFDDSEFTAVPTGILSTGLLTLLFMIILTGISRTRESGQASVR